MSSNATRHRLPLIAAALLLTSATYAQQFSDWSVPVSLGTTINSTAAACLLTVGHAFIFQCDLVGIIRANKGPARTARRQEQYP